jgi:pimeloyl-ACP methyl ester carboxylesterase
VVKFTDAGHFTHLEKPDEYLKEVAGFLVL